MTAIIFRRRKLGRGSTRGIQESSLTGITTVRNWVDDVPEDASIAFRWGCTSALPAGMVVVNPAASINWCSNKRQGRLDMQTAGVPVPKTWGSLEDYDSSDGYAERLVFRPAVHAQGKHLYVVNHEDGEQVEHRAHQFNSYYISELINKVAEYRVFVCQNRVVWVARKTPGNPEDVAWNVARGGRFDNVRFSEWRMPVIMAALKAAKVSGTDFCGVDVMVDAADNPYVLEVNSAPSQTSPYRQRCVAKAFDYIVTNGKEHFPDFIHTPRKTWRSYIHPALKDTENDTGP